MHYPLPDEMKAPFMRQIRLPDLKKYPNKEEVGYKYWLLTPAKIIIIGLLNSDRLTDMICRPDTII